MSFTIEKTITTVLPAGLLHGRVPIQLKLFSLKSGKWGLGACPEKMLPSICLPLIIFGYEYFKYIAGFGEVVQMSRKH